jgi:type I restriction enzyme S subunit
MKRLRFKDENGNKYSKLRSVKMGTFLSIPHKIKAENIIREKILSVKLHRKGAMYSENTKTLSLGSTTYYVRKKGQFIYGKQNFFNGAFDILSSDLDKGLSSGDVPTLNINSNIIDNDFFINFIGRESFYKSVEKYTSGTGSKRLHERQLLDLWIKLPALPEQEKIGSFLSAIDRLVDSQREKVELLKAFKKGYLQKLFPEKGQIVPHLRFKGFTTPWEYCRFGDISESFDYGLNASAIEYDGINKYLRITDIDEDTRLFKTNDLTSPNVDYNVSENYLLKKGDILFARTGASVGKSYIYKETDGKVYFAGFLIRAKIKRNYSPQFIYQTTLTDGYNKKIMITSQRSGQPGVNAKEYSSFEFMIPSYEEQAKIGEHLEKIDNLIAFHQRKLGTYELMKKGYMQRLFAE